MKDKIIIISTPNQPTPYLMDLFKKSDDNKYVVITKSCSVGMTTCIETQKFISGQLELGIDWDEDGLK